MGLTNILILTAMVALALFTVMTRSLLRAAIGLALTSAVLTVMMFRLGAPLAGVFELSVCAGLIPVIFITVISMTKPMKKEEAKEFAIERWSRFWILPIIVVIAAILLFTAHIKFDAKLPPVHAESDVRDMMWGARQLDMLGQVMVLMAGAYGILVLFKEMKKRW